MKQVCYYDPAERQHQKERARASDALQLRQGNVSQNDLRQRNSFLGSLEIVSYSIICNEVFA